MNIREPLQILLIEDRKSDVMLTELALLDMNLDFKLQHVTSVRDGLDFLRKKGPYTQNKITPDIVITDLNLPDLTGFEFLKAVRLMKGFQKMPVLVMTTSDSSKDFERSKQLKATDYIVKHIDFDIFSQRLASVIEPFLRIPATCI